jgi:sialic acid synthase SpsE
MIEVKRPGDGLPPDQIDSLIGRVLARNVEADHAFSVKDFEN